MNHLIEALEDISDRTTSKEAKVVLGNLIRGHLSPESAKKILVETLQRTEQIIDDNLDDDPYPLILFKSLLVSASLCQELGGETNDADNMFKGAK